MPLRYHPAAGQEIARAVRWYEQRVEGLGSRFLAEVEAALVLVEEDPARWAIVRGQTRRYSLRRFPYAIYYQVTDGGVWVLAVDHHSRHPRNWERREDGPPRETS